MTKTNTFFYILIVIIALLLLSLPYAVRATNDIATAIQSNGTLVELTAIWAELQNVSLATGIGNTTVSITVNIATNYSTATAYGRIKRDNVVLETFNLSKSYYAETVTFIAPVTETEGTHIYTFEAYCTAGRRCQIYNRTFSVQYLNTGSFGTGGGEGGNASYPINLSNTSQIIGTLAIDTTQNTSISALRMNDTYFNGTIFPQSTEFQNSTAVTANNTANLANSTVNANLGNWNSTYNATYANVNSSVQISRSQVTGQIGVDDIQNATLTDSKTNDTIHDAKFDAQNITNNLKLNKTDLNATVNINVSNATGTLSPDRLANNQKWFNANFMFGNGTGVATGIMNTYEIPKNGTVNFVRITTVNTTSNKGNLTGHILKKTCSLNQATTADSIGQFWINASNYSYSTLLSGVAISRGDCINDYITSSDNITRGTITIDFLES